MRLGLAGAFYCPRGNGCEAAVGLVCGNGGAACEVGTFPADVMEGFRVHLFSSFKIAILHLIWNIQFHIVNSKFPTKFVL